MAATVDELAGRVQALVEPFLVASFNAYDPKARPMINTYPPATTVVRIVTNLISEGSVAREVGDPNLIEVTVRELAVMALRSTAFQSAPDLQRSVADTLASLLSQGVQKSNALDGIHLGSALAVRYALYGADSTWPLDYRGDDLKAMIDRYPEAIAATPNRRSVRWVNARWYAEFSLHAAPEHWETSSHLNALLSQTGSRAIVEEAKYKDDYERLLLNFKAVEMLGLDVDHVVPRCAAWASDNALADAGLKISEALYFVGRDYTVQVERGGPFTDAVVDTVIEAAANGTLDQLRTVGLNG